MTTAASGTATPTTSQSSLDRLVDEFSLDLPRISDAAKNLLSEELAKAHVELRLPFEAADANEALGAVRIVLQAVNNVKLPSPVDYGVQFPQLDAQSGMSRIEELSKYKVAFTLNKKMLVSGQMPSKHMGKIYLQVVWPIVKPSLMQGASKPVENVVKALEASFSVENSSTLIDVVWTTDLTKALASRHAKRKEEASKRTEERVVMVDDDDDKDEE